MSDANAFLWGLAIAILAAIYHFLPVAIQDYVRPVLYVMFLGYLGVMTIWAFALEVARQRRKKANKN
jgi:hypothetical protein